MGQPMSALLPLFAASLAGRNYSAGTIRRYGDELRRYAAAHDDPTPEVITRQQLAAYRDGQAARGLSPASRNLTLAALDTFLGWCVEQGLVSGNAAADVQRPKLAEAAPRALSVAQVRSLLLAIEPPRPGVLSTHDQWLWLRNRRCILLMLYAGLRRKEVADRVWADVDFAGHVLAIQGKGGKVRYVPLRADLVLELSATPAAERVGPIVPSVHGGGHITAESIGQSIFRHWLVARGIEDVTPHMLRHTFATMLDAAGADLFDIQALLGHARVDTTKRYLKRPNTRLVDAVEQLPSPAELGAGTSIRRVK
jgi:site-specific recombinase XerD